MTERTQFTAYVTKYALTAGVQEILVEDCFDTSPTMVKDLREGAIHNYYHNGDWHRSRDEAVKRAEKMRAKKLASLQKQIDRIRKLVF